MFTSPIIREGATRSSFLRRSPRSINRQIRIRVMQGRGTRTREEGSKFKNLWTQESILLEVGWERRQVGMLGSERDENRRRAGADWIESIIVRVH